MQKKYDLILFDLDGTLLDTSPGIFNSVRYTERKMGFTRISDSRLPEFVGPPPKQMYQEIYGVDDQTALQAAKYHREYGSEKAIYEANVYPGILELLEKLKAAGYKLSVATLKSQSIAEDVLRIHNLYSYFDCIVGMDTNETLTKQDTIRIGIEKTGAKRPVLVGDSQYDFDGALAVGIDFIGVVYGFGLKGIIKDYSTILQPLELLKLV